MLDLTFYTTHIRQGGRIVMLSRVLTGGRIVMLSRILTVKKHESDEIEVADAIDRQSNVHFTVVLCYRCRQEVNYECC